MDGGRRMLSLACLCEAVANHSHLYLSSLKKMTVGMFLASMAFVAAAIVQVEIDVSCPLVPQVAFPAGQVECSRRLLRSPWGLGEARVSADRQSWSQRRCVCTTGAKWGFSGESPVGSHHCEGGSQEYGPMGVLHERSVDGRDTGSFH